MVSRPRAGWRACTPGFSLPRPVAHSVAARVSGPKREQKPVRRQRPIMKRTALLLTLAASVVFVAVGCAKPPQDDIAATQAEMDKARQAQAETWAPNELKAADEAMNAAQTEINAQNEKWFKNYDKAKELL